jgi:hypothetical protein
MFHFPVVSDRFGIVRSRFAADSTHIRVVSGDLWTDRTRFLCASARSDTSRGESAQTPWPFRPISASEGEPHWE